VERVAFGVVAPEQGGDVVGLVVGARGDAPTDRGVGDMDAAIGELVVEHPGVGDLGGIAADSAAASRMSAGAAAARMPSLARYADIASSLSALREIRPTAAAVPS
jgi:hypothetical protein